MGRGREIELRRNGESFPSGQRVTSGGPILRRLNFEAISTKSALTSDGELSDCVGRIRAAWAREAQNVLELADLIWRVRVRAQLPAALNTLYCLSELGREKIEELIIEGRIHPGLKLREAEALVAECFPEGCMTLRSKLQTRLNRFARFVRREMGTWTPQERETVAAELANLVREIRTATNEIAPAHRAEQARGSGASERSQARANHSNSIHQRL